MRNSVGTKLMVEYEYKTALAQWEKKIIKQQHLNSMTMNKNKQRKATQSIAYGKWYPIVI